MVNYTLFGSFHLNGIEWFALAVLVEQYRHNYGVDRVYSTVMGSSTDIIASTTSMSTIRSALALY